MSTSTAVNPLSTMSPMTKKVLGVGGVFGFIMLASLIGFTLAITLVILGVIGVFVYGQRYFTSEEFLDAKQDVSEMVEQHNRLARYAHEIERHPSAVLGGASTGQYAHLAVSENTSNWNYQRDKHVRAYGDERVHNGSLDMVRRAESDPIKYVMKYFDLPANEQSLRRVEEYGELMERLELAVREVEYQREVTLERVEVPLVIQWFFYKRLMRELNVDAEPFTVSYPTFVFEYVSAGGNSSQRTTIPAGREFIDALIEVMGTKIAFRKTAAGQRALMTTALRTRIKERDNYTCRYCGVSTYEQPHLLLEIDHIHPVSKGGLTTEANLQTLCWMCNRTKGAKIIEHDEE